MKVGPCPATSLHTVELPPFPRGECELCRTGYPGASAVRPLSECQRSDARRLTLLEQRVAEDTAKIEALRQATSIGIMDLEYGRFTQVNEGDLEHYLEGLSLTLCKPTRKRRSGLAGVSLTNGQRCQSGRCDTSLANHSLSSHHKLLPTCSAAKDSELHRYGGTKQ